LAEEDKVRCHTLEDFSVDFCRRKGLDSHPGSVELGECEAIELLAESRTLITKDTDRNRIGVSDRYILRDDKVGFRYQSLYFVPSSAVPSDLV